MERLSKEDRFAKAVNAGVDQIGGTEDSAMILAGLHDHKISQERVDEAVLRILTEKFQQGLKSKIRTWIRVTRSMWWRAKSFRMMR